MVSVGFGWIFFCLTFYTHAGLGFRDILRSALAWNGPRVRCGEMSILRLGDFYPGVLTAWDSRSIKLEIDIRQAADKQWGSRVALYIGLNSVTWFIALQHPVTLYQEVCLT